jgi:hypothetical protein
MNLISQHASALTFKKGAVTNLKLPCLFFTFGRGATKCHKREWRGKSSNVQHKLFSYHKETAVIKYTQHSELGYVDRHGLES